jgi:putative NADPH-quinone reductase
MRHIVPPLQRSVMKRLLVINGHPDPRPARFCGALSSAYERGAASAGWETRRVNIGDLPLSSVEAISQGEPPDADILGVLGDIEWANKLAIVFPLWFDRPPEALRAIFAHAEADARRGRKAHIIVTMDMPAFAYRSMLRPGATKPGLALSIPGLLPEEPVLIGCVTSITQEQRRQWLETIRGYGQRSWSGAAVGPSRTHVIASMIDRTVSQWWNGA